MPVVAYIRPDTLDAALTALSQPGAMVIGGGTTSARPRPAGPVTILDLQALGLDRIEETADDTVTVGATVTLGQLADHPAVPLTIRDAARREAPSALRTLATVAGCVATADPDSELLACLLVHNTRLALAAPDGARTVELAAVLADPGQLTGTIITAATIDTSGVTAVARTGRTHADRAIVAAVARRTPTGTLLLAVTGIAATPVLIPAGDVASSLAGCDPPGDFRGSGEYRRMLAGVLIRRALEEVGA